MVLASVLMVLSSLAGPAQSILYGKVFGQLVMFLDGSTTYSTFMASARLLCGMVMVVGLVRMALTWAGLFLWMQFGEKQQAHARTAITRSLVGRRVRYYDSTTNAVGESTQVNRCVEELRAGTAEDLALLIQTAATIVFSFVTSMIHAWSLTLVIMASAPLMAILGFVFGRLTFKAADAENCANAQGSQILEWTLSHPSMVRLFNGRRQEVTNFATSVNTTATAFFRLANVVSANMGILKALSLLTIVQGIWFGSHMILVGKLDVGNVFTAFSSCLLLASSISAVLELLATMNKAHAAASKIGSFTNEAESVPVKGYYPLKAEGSLEFNDVSFTHAHRIDVAVANVSIKFAAGSWTFIVGESGSGKSTLVQLALGLYESEGNVLIDGYLISHLTPQWIYDNITLVESESIIFDDTLANNVAMASPGALAEEIAQACSFAAIDFASPSSQTPLSGGQQQMVNLARAWLRDSPILILDEALSAIDTKKRTLLMGRLRRWRRNKTTIFITHDLAHIGDNDYVVVMEGGRTKEQGCYSDLSVYLYHRSIPQDSTPNEKTSSYEPPLKEKPPRMLTLSILRYCLPHISKMYVAIGLAASIATSVLSPVYSVLFSQLLGSLVLASLNHTSLLARLSGAMIGISVATGLAQYLSSFVLNVAAEKWVVMLRKDIFARLCDQDMAYFDDPQTKPAEITALLMNDTRDLRNLVADYLSVVLNLVISLVIGIVWSIVVGWKLALVGLAFVPLILVVTGSYSRLQVREEHNYKTAVASLESYTHQCIHGHRTIVTMNLSEYILEKFDHHLKTVRIAGLRRAIVTGLGIALGEVCLSFATGTVLLYGIQLVAEASYTYSSFFQVATILSFTFANATMLLKQIPDIGRGQRAGSYVVDLMKLQPLPLEVKGGAPPQAGPIVLKNVSFGYTSGRVLKNVSMTLHQNKVNVLVGPSGSGKSTVLSLVARLYGAELGSVLLNGTDITKLDVTSLRTLVAVVPQKPVFFEGTIYDNLVYGLDRVLELTITRSLQLAQISATVKNLPLGLRTSINGVSRTLSSGQLQRLSIARALVRRPAILLLDECTSNLDSENTRAIVDVIRGLAAQDLTIVIVTHDQLVMSIGDNVITLNGKTI